MMTSLFQYPGVAESIDSDIDNLSSILTMWDMVPQGKSVAVS